MQTEGLRELALFAGAGGGILGGVLLGWRTVCAVENDPYARDVLVARQNDGCLAPFPIWDDATTFDGKQWCGRVDVISGGFPCQAYSTAAHGANNARCFWPEMRRVVGEVSPRYVFAENVSRKAIDTAADDLEQMGYEARCLSLSARDLGADHGRERYWLLAHANVRGKLRGHVNAEAQLLSEFRPGVWDTGTDELRVAHGVAARVDRLRCCGNGQVPAVAALAWRILTAGLPTIGNEASMSVQRLETCMPNI